MALNDNAALNRMVELLGGGITAVANNWDATTDPDSSDYVGYEKGSFWYNASDDKLFVAVVINTLAEEALWTRIDVDVPVFGIYTALISQTGTNAPTTIVLQNTLPTTPVWSYVGIGIYKLTGSALAYNIAAPYTFDNNGATVTVKKTGAQEITVTALLNGLLTNALIDLKVYNT